MEEKLVCDRCGADIYQCVHAYEGGYFVEKESSYKKGRLILQGFFVSIVAVCLYSVYYIVTS